MLVLKIPQNDSVIIDLREFGLGLIEAMTVHGHPHTKIGFKADQRIPIHRKEVWEAIEREGRRRAV